MDGYASVCPFQYSEWNCRPSTPLDWSPYFRAEGFQDTQQSTYYQPLEGEPAHHATYCQPQYLPCPGFDSFNTSLLSQSSLQLPVSIDALHPSSGIISLPSAINRDSSSQSDLENCSTLQPLSALNEEDDNFLSITDPSDFHVYEFVEELLSQHTSSKPVRPKQKTCNVCTLCGKSYAHRQTLTTHIRENHSGTRTIIKCDVCDRVYKSQNTLRKHKKVHTGVVHRCLTVGCNKTFLDLSTLNKHKRIHTGDKPYSCYIPNCLARFNQSGNLTKHIRKIHHKGTAK